MLEFVLLKILYSEFSQLEFFLLRKSIKLTDSLNSFQVSAFCIQLREEGRAYLVEHQDTGNYPASLNMICYEP